MLRVLSLFSLALLAACGGGGGGGGGGSVPFIPITGVSQQPAPSGQEAIGTVRQMYDGALTPDLAVSTFRNIDRLFPTRTIAKGSSSSAFVKHEKQITDLSFKSGQGTYGLSDFIAQNRISGLLVLKDGKVALERYELGNTEKTRWMSMSIAKSISSTLVGAALKDGVIASLDDQVTRYVPKLVGSAYDGVTVKQVLTMTSGVRWNETYTDPASDRRAMLEAQISQKPGAILELMAKLPRAAEPGTRFNYSTGETQILGEILRGAIKRPLAEYLSEKIWKKYGMEADSNWWLESPEGLEIAGSGLSATLRDYGRFGQFFMNGGIANGEKVLPDNWLADATSPVVLKDGTKLNGYGYMWWLDGAPAGAINEGAFNAIGIFGQTIHVNPKERLVVVVWSARTQPDAPAPINESAFFGAVANAMH
jgi:CubicO group peptidase (beta-lactamase class C family)